jgi:hypothetical protein
MTYSKKDFNEKKYKDAMNTYIQTFFNGKDVSKFIKIQKQDTKGIDKKK